jgi:DNA invertase Pin-like site-specific DNA recombinase
MRNPQILRPAFKEMMAAIMSNGVKTIVVERLDRLSRKYVIQEQLLLYVAGKECDFYSADTGDNVAEAIRGDPMKKAIIQMQGIFLELERSMLVKKLKIAKDKKRAAGFRVDGMLPFGEKLGEKEVVARMVELRGQGLTPGHIAEKLNAEGAKTRMNAKWHRTSIIRVLGRAAV